MSIGLVAGALAAPPAVGRDGGDADREEVRVGGVCGDRSRAQLRVRADDGALRVDLRVRTATRGLWRVVVLHERRIAHRARVRATRDERGFEHRIFLADYPGPDEIRFRAVSPRAETCTAETTLGGES